MSKEKDLMKRLISDTAKMDGLYYLWGKIQVYQKICLHLCMP